MEKIANSSGIATRTEYPYVFAVSTQLTTQETKILGSLKTALYKQPLNENTMCGVNFYFNCLFKFKVSVQLKSPTSIVMLVSLTTLSGGVEMLNGHDLEMLNVNMKAGKGDGELNTNLSEGDEIPNGHDLEILNVNMKAGKEDGELNFMQDNDTGSKGLGAMPTAEAVIPYKKEEQVQGSSRTHIKTKSQETGKRKTLAVLISYPHGQQQPYVTLGFVENINEYGEVFYTTPSCDGSSGAPAWLISRTHSSGAELEDIRFATHSSGADAGVGVLFILPGNPE